jgi:hypothetical protein
MSVSEALLRTIAEAPLALPERRAEAELRLLLGDFDPHATMLDLIAAASSPAAAPRDFFGDLMRALRAAVDDTSAAAACTERSYMLPNTSSTPLLVTMPAGLKLGAIVHACK